MSLTWFPITGEFKAVISDGSDIGSDPDLQNISAFIYFTPSVDQVHSAVDGITYRLQTIRGRINVSDGQVKTIDGGTLTLPANTNVLGLEELRYRVTFDAVVYDKSDQVTIDGFEFIAPTSNTAVNLATVERFPLPPPRR